MPTIDISTGIGAVFGGAGVAVTIAVQQWLKFKRSVSSEKVESTMDEGAKQAVKLMQTELERAHARNEEMYAKFLEVSLERNSAYKKIAELTIQLGNIQADQHHLQQQLEYLTTLTKHLITVATNGDAATAEAAKLFINLPTATKQARRCTDTNEFFTPQFKDPTDAKQTTN